MSDDESEPAVTPKRKSNVFVPDFSNTSPVVQFQTYVTEAEAMMKKNNFKRALAAYNRAASIRPDDEPTLLARSACFIKLGNSASALDDANHVLKTKGDSCFKGLVAKGEALYAAGDSEFALVYFHRAQKGKQSLDVRLGIQKSTRAILETLGLAEPGSPSSNRSSRANLRASRRDLNRSRGNLQMSPSMARVETDVFTASSDNLLGQKGRIRSPSETSLTRYSRNRGEKSTVDESSPLAAGTPKGKGGIFSPDPPAGLIGALQDDKSFLEALMVDPMMKKIGGVEDLANGGLNYIDSRVEFWKNQENTDALSLPRVNSRAGLNRSKKGHN